MAAGSVAGYSDLMNSKRLFPTTTTTPIGLVLGATLLVSLTGCVAYVDRPAEGSVYVEPNATFAVQDDYVYYPDYECYYSVSRHQYAYREGNAWVARPAPRGVTVNVLMASPSVHMNFHDSPANHHAAVVQQYPKSGKPSGSNQRTKEDRKDNQSGGNNGH
jgi:hypothetical protein